LRRRPPLDVTPGASEATTGTGSTNGLLTGIAPVTVSLTLVAALEIEPVRRCHIVGSVEGVDVDAPILIY
jgi:hypothetical protein